MCLCLLPRARSAGQMARMAGANGRQRHVAQVHRLPSAVPAPGLMHIRSLPDSSSPIRAAIELSAAASSTLGHLQILLRCRWSLQSVQEWVQDNPVPAALALVAVVVGATLAIRQYNSKLR